MAKHIQRLYRDLGHPLTKEEIKKLRALIAKFASSVKKEEKLEADRNKFYKKENKDNGN